MSAVRHNQVWDRALMGGAFVAACGGSSTEDAATRDMSPESGGSPATKQGTYTHTYNIYDTLIRRDFLDGNKSRRDGGGGA